jgi:hypothetical protein
MEDDRGVVLQFRRGDGLDDDCETVLGQDSAQILDELVRAVRLRAYLISKIPRGSCPRPGREVRSRTRRVTARRSAYVQ